MHTVYEEAKALADELRDARDRLAFLRREKFTLETMYTDAELEFIADTRADNPDLSQTAFDKFVKGHIHKNPRLRELRAVAANQAYKIDGHETEVAHIRARLDIATARMGELGGYLHYLAELKRAETASVGLDNWPPDSAVPR